MNALETNYITLNASFNRDHRWWGNCDGKQPAWPPRWRGSQTALRPEQGSLDAWKGRDWQSELDRIKVRLRCCCQCWLSAAATAGSVPNLSLLLLFSQQLWSMQATEAAAEKCGSSTVSWWQILLFPLLPPCSWSFSLFFFFLFFFLLINGPAPAFPPLPPTSAVYKTGW